MTQESETLAVTKQSGEQMRRWTQIEEINVGDVVLRSNGLLAPPSEIVILSLHVAVTYAVMTWRWNADTNHYYSTDFRKSTNMIDYGSWHDLTTQQWSLVK